MTHVPVRKLLGVGNIPSHRTSASKWLSNNGISVQIGKSKGGKAEFVRLIDLPQAERLAYLQRESEHLNLDPGVFDDVAHEAFMQAPPSRREQAERKAEIARFLVSLGDKIVWREREKLVHDRFGAKGNSARRLKAIMKRIKGFDPINVTPALLDNYTCGVKGRADMSTDAWRFFMTVIHNAAPEFPLSAAWRDTRDVVKTMGWAVPSYPTLLPPLARLKRGGATYSTAWQRSDRKVDHDPDRTRQNVDCPVGMGVARWPHTRFLG